ncbi:phospholipase D-like domain-containing protein [Halomonas binhaiensis]|uniref:Phospholipase n=1 Tax=Halomonas binhaiensis TaxID=2562282 RepID=A0A5C1NEC7_9GAMM|nr:phospholipase D-like domain-containing protein [Halomonas binhaiensis]QEM81604.1 phospholipase [Halomonas binhaiensis]
MGKRFKLIGIKWLGAGLALAWLSMGIWQSVKPLPEGIGKAWPERKVTDVRFLADRTWYDARGKRHMDQHIFDEALSMILGARRLIVMDMFLFNALEGQDAPVGLRPIAEELSDALIEAKQRHPDMQVVMITDPLNTVYGGVRLKHLEHMKAAGIDIVITDLDRLRASNPLYSGLYHLGLDRLGNDPDGGWLPNAFGGDPVTLRSYLALPNFRANHRKTLVADDGQQWAALVGSANPHDGSSRHGNVALRVEGEMAHDLVASEAVLTSWAGVELAMPTTPAIHPAEEKVSTGATVQLLTEGAIRDASLEMINAAGQGDRLDLAAFYISHRQVIEALKGAAARGVNVRALLDRNREAFGFDKGGLPNQAVAAELAAAGIQVRWCLTAGEQCHSKVLRLHSAASSDEAILGSANLTRRNIDNLNLETSVLLKGEANLPALRDQAGWFNERWASSPDHRTSLAWEPDDDPGRFSAWRYRVMEAIGLSTF